MVEGAYIQQVVLCFCESLCFQLEEELKELSEVVDRYSKSTVVLIDKIEDFDKKLVFINY